MATPFIAQITLFAGNFAPRGWAFCNGQIMSIAQNTALFSLLGTTYGGNGQTTFALPDLRSRVPMHPGQGPGLTNRSLGEQGGTEAHTLNSNEMPAHNHAAQLPVASGEQTTNRAQSGSNARGGVYAPADTTGPAVTVGIAGGSQPHNNVQPFTALNYIIAVEGIFPSRN